LRVVALTLAGKRQPARFDFETPPPALGNETSFTCASGIFNRKRLSFAQLPSKYGCEIFRSGQED
jgi:hypothetical protein